jgi:hypothetical protein
VLLGRPDGKGLLGRSRPRWVDNIKVGFVDIRWNGVKWIGLAQDVE